nr:hypothetical protein [Campylobacter sp.]
MKKLLFLICLANSLMFAQNLQNYELINLATNDLRGIEVDDEECQKAILDFYSLVVKDSKLNIKLTKEYKECMYKKANGHKIEEIKELERELKARKNALKNEIAEFVEKSDSNETQI